jgi:hypothetical protein
MQRTMSKLAAQVQGLHPGTRQWHRDDVLLCITSGNICPLKEGFDSGVE